MLRERLRGRFLSVALNGSKGLSNAPPLVSISVIPYLF